MFDPKSDYAVNKSEPEAIIYQAAGSTIILTKADFDTEAEFLQWKHWSDQNYRETERQNRPSATHLVLDEATEAAAVLLDFMEEDEGEAVPQELRQLNQFRLAYHLGKRTLTTTQRRRLMLYAAGMRVGEIAHSENVTKQSVSESLSAAKRKLSKVFRRIINFL